MLISYRLKASGFSLCRFLRLKETGLTEVFFLCKILNHVTLKDVYCIPVFKIISVDIPGLFIMTLFFNHAKCPWCIGFFFYT